MQARSPISAIALLLACACGSFMAACDESKAHREDAGDEEEEDASSDGGGGNRDGGGGNRDGGGGGEDGGGAGGEGGTDASNGGGDASDSDGGSDGGTDSGPADPLAPFALNCGSLPSNGVCQGGPREVLLVTEESGVIAMFDPGDGHFLGYLKRPAASYWAEAKAEYNFATQGPDQCIWTASEEVGIERWNTDGTFRDTPLDEHSLPRSGAPDEDALQDPITFAFSANKLYVNSTSGYPNARVLAWNLDGSFDKIVLEEEMTVESLLVLGDGSLLIADSDRDRVVRIPSAGGPPIPVLGGIEWPGQISYAGDRRLLVSEITSGSAMYEVNVETMMAREIFPQSEYASNKYGIAPLLNGKWLFTGGDFLISALDPASTNPSGQNAKVWEDDSAVDSVNFKFVGRACLPAAIVESRASKPANNTCVAPPDGPVLFAEDFEGTGDFTGSGTDRHYNAFYDRGTSGVTTSIGAGPTEGADANSTRTVRISGAGTRGTGNNTQYYKTGLFANMTNGQPKYASYRVFVPAIQERSLGFFMLSNVATNTYQYDYLMATYVYNGYARGGRSNAASGMPDRVGKWLRIELREIDWNSRTFDLYVDCERIGEGIPLPAGFGDSVDRIDLFNNATSSATPSAPPDEDTVAWYDDILIK